MADDAASGGMRRVESTVDISSDFSTTYGGGGGAAARTYAPPLATLTATPEGDVRTPWIATLEQYRAQYKESLENPQRFWGAAARELVAWTRPFDEVCGGGFAAGDVRWFGGGRLNACYNCVDRHAAATPERIALLWEGDSPAQVRRISYAELLKETCRVAGVLLELGVRRGDRVAIYMPMVPETVYCMLACARLGAVHSVVFGGFSAEALRDRIIDAQARVLITADVARRGGRSIPLKKVADEALLGCTSIECVLVHQHGETAGSSGGGGGGASATTATPMKEGRDRWLHVEMARQRPYCPCEPMDAEDTLFFLYTSGSTGKPKGVAHTTGGYLVYATMTHRYIFDYHAGDVYACVADIGWITGHTYVVYGPLSNGATTLLFESVPSYPDHSRYWDMVQRHRVAVFYGAPTAIRSLMAHGDAPVKKHDRSSLRVLGTVGEPINPEVWRWYHDVVGDGRCAVVDTYWQTETGGIIVTPLPAATPTKPGSATLPFFGIELAVLDAKTGAELTGPAGGVLAVKRPWPGMARTIHGDHQRYIDVYLGAYKGYYFTGDGCHRDADGYIWITGRVDDVINKSGHRLGSAEIESALVCHPACAEAAVVAIPDAMRGQGVFAYCILRQGFKESHELVEELRLEVKKHIGSIAVPDVVVLTPTLCKTRSGKIMRRILRKLACREPKDALGDLSTLADPAAVDVLLDKIRQYYPAV